MTLALRRGSLDRWLSSARAARPTAHGSHGEPPANARGLHVLERTVQLDDDAKLDGVGDALLDWQVQRGAGLVVCAAGPAEPGATVVLAVPAMAALGAGHRLGKVGPWVVAPCRVIDSYRQDDRVGFAYATLPGHPERGMEEFVVTRRTTADGSPGGLWFSVRAWSVPGARITRWFPSVTRAAQERVTQAYLDAAVSISKAQ